MTAPQDNGFKQFFEPSPPGQRMDSNWWLTTLGLGLCVWLGGNIASLIVSQFSEAHPWNIFKGVGLAGGMLLTRLWMHERRKRN